MFDRIAGPYDLMNRVMTAGLDRRWRALAARESGVGRGADGARRLLRHGRPRARAGARRRAAAARSRASTSRPRCCARAARKTPRPDAAPSQWVRGDATAMPFADDSFAAATIGFGLRNLPDPDAGLRELRARRAPRRARRLPRDHAPGARPLKGFYSLWFDRGIPAARPRLRPRRRLLATCPPRCAASRPRRARRGSSTAPGMSDVRYRLLAGGIVALHVGEVVE